MSLSHNWIRSLTRSGDDSSPSSSFSSSSRPSFALERIDLSHNHLHVLHSGVLAGGAFPSLRHLNLSGNAIHTVAPSAVVLPALQTLDLSDNALEEVWRHLFEWSPSLSEVALAGNRLSSLDDGALATVLSLSLLDLSRNQLMRVEAGALAGVNVTHLDLSDNALRRVPAAALARAAAVRTLLLDGNHFRSLDRGSLADVPAEFVSVSRCPSLERAEAGAVERARNLRALTLNSNPRLSYVSPEVARDAPKLTAIDLSRNGLYALVIEKNKINRIALLLIPCVICLFAGVLPALGSSVPPCLVLGRQPLPLPLLTGMDSGPGQWRRRED